MSLYHKSGNSEQRPPSFRQDRDNMYSRNVSTSNHDHRHHVSDSSKWQSATNSKGNLVIAKTADPKPKSLAYEKATKKIWLLVAEYKTDASRNEIDKLTTNIMKVCDKYKRGEYSGERRISTKEQPKKASPKRTTVAKKVTSPEERINRAVGKVKESGRKVPNELLRLINTDGFVTSPIRAKRTPKHVARFDESDFASSREKRKKRERSMKSAGKKSTVFINNFKIPLISKQRVLSAAGPAPASVKRNVLSQSLSTTTTTNSSVKTIVDHINTTTQTTVTKTKTCNFVHNEVRIFHMPMTIKVEKDNN